MGCDDCIEDMFPFPFGLEKPPACLDSGLGVASFFLHVLCLKWVHAMSKMREVVLFDVDCIAIS